MAQKKRVYGILEHVKSEEQFPIYDEAFASYARLKLTDKTNRENIRISNAALVPETSTDTELTEFDRLSYKFVSPEVAKRSSGRSIQWTNASEFADKVEEYFTICADSYEEMLESGKNDRWIIPTINGLALHLGMVRETLLKYEKEQHDISNKTPEQQAEMRAIADTVKKAKATIEANEEQLATKGKINPILAIWREKTRFGYEEQSKRIVQLEGGNKPIQIEGLSGKELDSALSEVLKTN